MLTPATFVGPERLTDQERDLQAAARMCVTGGLHLSENDLKPGYPWWDEPPVIDAPGWSPGGSVHARCYQWFRVISTAGDRS